MKTFSIEWGTDFCEDFPDRFDFTEIEAETEEEAVQKFRDLKIYKSIIYRVQEVKGN